MKKSTIFLTTLFLMIAQIMVSCKKGDTGPAGPAGPQGSTGAAGATGASGQAGTANVIYSDWITKMQSDWNGIGTSTIFTTIGIPQLTADIRNKGVVLIYYDFNGSVKLLPYTYGAAGDLIDFTLDTGLVAIRMTNLGGNVIGSIDPTKFRYILMPGGVLSGRFQNSLDYSDYNKVCTYYNIP